MPWKYTFVPNPSDKNLKVHKTLPEGFKDDGLCCWTSFKIARVPAAELIKNKQSGKKLDLRNFYFCRFCEGWIEGDAYEYRENTIGPLCGRDGTVYSCIRCGHELGFSGRVS